MNSVQRSILFFGGRPLWQPRAIHLSPPRSSLVLVAGRIRSLCSRQCRHHGNCRILSGFGGGNYLIQKRELSPADVRSAFTITLVISVAIAFLLFVLAGALSDLFAQDSLKRGIEISALNFLLVPVSGTVSALLRRDMKFGTFSRLQLGSRCCGCLRHRSDSR